MGDTKFLIQQCSAAPKIKRGYTRQTTWDGLKDTVSQDIQRGIPHKTILAKIAKLGVSIKPHQFKRLLRDWGLSDRNIHKRHRKYIFLAEKAARIQGIKIQRWRFNDTGQYLDRARIRRILENKEKDFESKTSQFNHSDDRIYPVFTLAIVQIDVESSPGGLAPSPLPQLDQPQSDNGNPTNEDFSPSYENNSEDSEMADALLIPEVECCETILSLGSIQCIKPEGHVQVLLPENGFLVNQPRSTKENAVDNDDKEGGKLESQEPDSAPNALNTLLQSFCEDLLQSIDALDSLNDSLGKDILDELTPYELVDYLSQIFRKDLEQWKSQQTSKAEEYICKVDSLQARGKLSRPESERLITQRGEGWPWWNGYEMMGYEEAFFFTSEAPSNSYTVITDIFNGVIPIFYNSIPLLWKAIGSETPTFKNFCGDIKFDETHRKQFRAQIIHLPYLQKKYGDTHFTTISALYSTVCMIQEYGESPGLEIHLLEAAMVLLESRPISPCLGQKMSTLQKKLIRVHISEHNLDAATTSAMKSLDMTTAMYGSGSLYSIRAAAMLMLATKYVVVHEAALTYQDPMEWCEFFLFFRARFQRLNESITQLLQDIPPLKLQCYESRTYKMNAVLDIISCQIEVKDPAGAIKTARILENGVFEMLQEYSQLRPVWETEPSNPLLD
ncbi:hypothetical protein H072_3366 [Dactylellina haptotyla CBS 200.50]|uniref:Clr5 domain-containing protein n=1 Tax=Dactylellina haptotyla (strain CBS 200.50) TaxID=1284197 RepID=S8BSX0_DACHA|nr:hypothetical protein H072_3366 [Dactylellina haptotyla CBS 200.50]